MAKDVIGVRLKATMELDKRGRRILEGNEEQRKSPSTSASLLMNSVRPIQSDPDKYPGFYIFQESFFGNVILPCIPRPENPSK